MAALPTQPLDPMAVLLAQLGRIERSIETLPGLLERVAALTDSTKQLEETLRTITTELRQRDEQQQRSIEDIRLRQSETMAAVAAVSATLQDLRTIPQRVAALEQQFGTLANSLCDDELRKRVDSQGADLQRWTPFLGALKWGVTVIGGIILTALTGALLWALIQSGVK